MARKEKKYHYIYKTTCTINGKYYIGIHSTDNLDDRYQGSGQRLWKSLKKHGRHNHTTEILEFLIDRNELKKREAEIVNEELIKDPLCINIALGGGSTGNGVFINHDQVTKDKIAKSLSKPYSEIYGKSTDLQKSKRKIAAKEQWANYSDEDRKSLSLKISAAVKEHWSNNEYIVIEYVCPHCGKIGKGAAMFMHHFNNCKLITGKSRVISDETREKIKNTLTGRNLSEETKNKLKGKIPANKGIKYERIECPHCKKLVATNIANRNHFDNCLNKTI